MRVRSWLLPSAFAATSLFALGSIGCHDSDSGAVMEPRSAANADDPSVDVGDSLYTRKPAAKTGGGVVSSSEPLVIGNCTVQFEQRQQVSAEVDGKIELLAVRDDDINPTDPLHINHPRDKNVKYRMIKEGAIVKRGQVICMLDDQIADARMKSAQKARAAAEFAEKSASEGVQLSSQKAELTLKAFNKGSAPLADYIQDRITVTRFEENKAQAIQTIAKAEAEFEENKLLIHKHQIRSNVNGVVRSIARREGEFVKAGEKILEVQAIDVVRLEGSLDVQYKDLVKPGMTVAVEPAVPSAPMKSHRYHQKEITGVAVSANPGRPLVVSTSADGTARVWDATRETPLHNLPHPVPVRSVACSPVGAKPIVAITGSDDGKVRIWDLSNPAKLPTEPREPADKHSAAIGAIAFSPNGKYFATAAGREVFIWDAAEGKKLYALPPEHRDTVTSLSFTPQCTLVTASKDRSLKVWKLGVDKAGVMRTIDHRAGVVDVLGVTSDGGRVVYDQDKDRLDLVGIADRQTFGQVQNSSSTAAFATLAVFNPNDTLLLTAGGDGELKGGLQIWNLPPSGGRGSEIARLFTPGRVPTTAAAFSPDKEHRFLVVGTSAGSVHMWKPPAQRKPYTGMVVFVETIDANKVNVRVEMNNPKELNLMDRSTASIIITP
ncbi:MAG TPA: HlyD family efflux transporter periplasmic adaptor subunit [Urbifossiella sp.]|nr:HlyD family efflux transporter periplasmic adaptor subunit [Urbifossiella sp.]